MVKSLKTRLERLETRIVTVVTRWPTLVQWRAYQAGQMSQAQYEALHSPADLERQRRAQQQVLQAISDFTD